MAKEVTKEVTNETERLEELYQHYRKLYFKYFLLCCSKERRSIRRQRDHLKSEIERKIKERCDGV